MSRRYGAQFHGSLPSGACAEREGQVIPAPADGFALSRYRGCGEVFLTSHIFPHSVPLEIWERLPLGC